VPERNLAELLSASLFSAESAFLNTRATPMSHDSLEKSNELGVAYTIAGRYEDALAQFELAAQGYRMLSGPEHPNTLIAAGNLAVTYSRLERWDDAIPLIEETAAVRERVLGEEHRLTMTAYDALAVTFRQAGRLSEALPIHQRVVVQRTAMLGPAHPDTLVSILGLAVAIAEAGDPQHAVARLSSALQESEQIDRLDVIAIALRARLADFLLAMGQPDEAVDHLRRAISECEALQGVNHPEAIALRSHLSRMGRDDGAADVQL
jgi:tetratricopeptide (TPR) repeat protein